MTMFDAAFSFNLTIFSPLFWISMTAPLSGMMTLVFRQIVRLAGDLAVDAQHVVIAVERHEEFRMDLFVYPGRLVAVGMAGRMDVGDPVVDDVGALAGEVVLQFLDGALVAGDDGRREEDGVALCYLDIFMRLVGHAHHGGIFVALGAGSQDD